MTTSPAEHLPRCRRHDWSVGLFRTPEHWDWRDNHDCFLMNCTGRERFPEPHFGDSNQWVGCKRCGKPRDPALSKRGRNNRSRGNRAELSVARKYGGEKVGQLGLPEDIRGTEYRTQVKTHQRPAPSEWRKAFAALEAVTDNRTPRLIVRFLQPGVPADDYIIIRGRDWLDRFGTDEEETTRDAA